MVPYENSEAFDESRGIEKGRKDLPCCGGLNIIVENYDDSVIWFLDMKRTLPASQVSGLMSPFHMRRSFRSIRPP